MNSNIAINESLSWEVVCLYIYVTYQGKYDDGLDLVIWGCTFHKVRVEYITTNSRN